MVHDAWCRRRMAEGTPEPGRGRRPGRTPPEPWDGVVVAPAPRSIPPGPWERAPARGVHQQIARTSLCLQGEPRGAGSPPSRRGRPRKGASLGVDGPGPSGRMTPPPAWIRKRERARAHGARPAPGGAPLTVGIAWAVAVAHLRPTRPPAGRPRDAGGQWQADRVLPDGLSMGAARCVVALAAAAGPDPALRAPWRWPPPSPQGHQPAQTVLPVQEGAPLGPLPCHAGSCEGIGSLRRGARTRWPPPGREARAVRLESPRLGPPTTLGYLLRAERGDARLYGGLLARASSPQRALGPSSIRDATTPGAPPLGGVTPGSHTCVLSPGVQRSRRRGGHRPAPGGAGLSAPATASGWRTRRSPWPGGGRPPAGPPGGLLHDACRRPRPEWDPSRRERG